MRRRNGACASSGVRELRIGGARPGSNRSIGRLGRERDTTSTSVAARRRRASARRGGGAAARAVSPRPDGATGSDRRDAVVAVDAGDLLGQRRTCR